MTETDPRRRWSVVAALSLAGLACLFGGCGEEEDLEPVGREAAREAAADEYEGEALYARYCALCHGLDAEGYAADNAPSLRSREWQRTASDVFIRQAIADGRSGTPMSAWSRQAGGPLDDRAIDAIVTYLRTHLTDPRATVDHVVVNGDPARGQQVFAAQCARCHGERGEGVDAVALANPELLASVSDGFLQYAVAHGRTGTRMPAFAGELSPTEIDDVVTFVRSLGPHQAPPSPHPEQEDAPPLPSLDEMPLVINPDGRSAQLTLREDRFVPAAQVAQAMERGQRIVVLDARATSDWLTQRIPGAVPVPFYELTAIIETLPRDGTWMVAYCACPHAASGRVVDALREAGFTHTAVIDEGIDHWVTSGYPTASGPTPP